MSVKNVLVLIDVQNLYHSSLHFGGNKISYKKLIDKIGEDRNVIQATAYAAHRDGKAAKAFYSALKAVGIEVRSKFVTVKKLDTGGNKIIPAHFDSEITYDATMYPEGTDIIVLCTGNGNFEYLVNNLVEDGIEVEIWSFKESTSDKLIKNAKFVAIPKECLLTGNDKDEEVKGNE